MSAFPPEHPYFNSKENAQRQVIRNKIEIMKIDSKQAKAALFLALSKINKF